jgi:hypothetical protein
VDTGSTYGTAEDAGYRLERRVGGNRMTIIWLLILVGVKLFGGDVPLLAWLLLIPFFLFELNDET